MLCSPEFLSGFALKCRFICTSSALQAVRAGRVKSSKYKTKLVTYEAGNLPEDIGARKSWLTWNTSNLETFGKDQAHRAVEDETVRRLIYGIWHNLFVTELVFKRRGNLLVIAGIVQQTIPPRKMYFLLGFTEELLSNMFKQPVKMEIQSVTNVEEVAYYYV